MSRTVIIGLDAFHEDLLQFTPHIQSIFEENPSGSLESTDPPVTAPAWASFQTGKNQGKHGVYDFVEFDDDFDTRILDGEALQSETFYERLDDAGESCFLYNLPFSFPARISGDVVPSWLDPDDREPAPNTVYDKYGIDSPKFPSFDGQKIQRLSQMRSSAEFNGKQFRKVLREDDHDFLFQLISETDWLQHLAYYDLFERPESGAGEISREVLTTVDSHINQIDSLLDDSDRLLLISDHGFKSFEGQLYINDWLHEHGYLEIGNDEIGTKEQNDESIQLGTFGRILFQQEWLHPVLKRTKSLIENISDVKFSAEDGIDAESSAAYCLSKDEYAVRLSEDLAASKRQKIRDELIDKLNDVQGLEARRGDELYWGPYTDDAGDIVLSSEKYKIWRGPSGLTWRESRKSHHSSDGVIAAKGFSESNPEIELDASLLDVAPTILAESDHPVPKDMDGDAITKLLSNSPEYVETEQYSLAESIDDKSANRDAEDRLKDLGYL